MIFSKIVGRIEILREALSKKEGSGIQLDWVNVWWKRKYSWLESIPMIKFDLNEKIRINAKLMRKTTSG
jgi:hypothetical protein